MVTTQGRSTTKGQTIKLQQCNTLRFTLVQQYLSTAYHPTTINRFYKNRTISLGENYRLERKKERTRLPFIKFGFLVAVKEISLRLVFLKPRIGTVENGVMY